MNFSAQKARRNMALWRLGAAAQRPMVTVAAVVLMLCGQAQPAAARQPLEIPGAACSGRAGRSRAGSLRAVSVPLPKPRPAEAPAIEPDKPAEGKQTPVEADRPAEHAAPAPPALGLPAGAVGGDRDRPQHSRHPWRRRLRRRGSGAAGGRGAAGQASGRGQARGDPALRHGVGDRGLGPHRHRSRWRPVWAAPSPISTISTRSNAAAATASPARPCPNMAAPTRSMFAPSSLPTASRFRSPIARCRASCARACCIRYARGFQPCWGRARTGITRTISIST